jgi:hypothetical protein
LKQLEKNKEKEKEVGSNPSVESDFNQPNAAEGMWCPSRVQPLRGLEASASSFWNI